MSDQIKCRCPRCTIRGLMGPAVVIAVGVLFLLQQTHSGEYDFGRTYPLILIVIGAILLASSLSPMDGHISSDAVATQTPSGPTSSPNSPQGPLPGQGQ